MKGETSEGHVSYYSLVVLKRVLDGLNDHEPLKEILRGSKVIVPALRQKSMEVIYFHLIESNT